MNIPPISSAYTIAGTELRITDLKSANSDSNRSKSLEEGITLSEDAQSLGRFDALLNSVEYKPNEANEPIDPKSMELLTEKQSSQFLTGVENTLSLGWMLLGQSSGEWKQKGLELDKESVMEAGRVLKTAFRQALDRNPEGQFALSFDRHGIVASQQAVTEWFTAERDQEMSLLPDSVRQTFERGELFHIVDRA